MSTSFDWQFEEDERSGKLNAVGPPPERRRRWLLKAIIVFFVVASVTLAVRAWVRSREQAIREVEGQLRAIVELELQTVADGDAELFRVRQDPADAEWKARQVARFVSAGSDQFAPGPGLEPAERPMDIKQVHVFGHTARVELTRWYNITDTEPASVRISQSTSVPISRSRTVAASQPLPFHLTWFYQQDEDGIWYHVAPPEGYWGPNHIWRSDMFSIYATKAEADTIEGIADHLFNLVARGCQLITCKPEIRYVLWFDDVLSPRSPSNHWELPALYLAGLPEDKAARDVWLQSLEPWVIDALARVTHGAAADRVIYRHLVNRLQVELGSAEPLEVEAEVLTQTVLDRRQHWLQELWEAEYETDDLDGTRVLDAEMAALLTFFEDQVGTERLFELFDALPRYPVFDAALWTTFDIEPRAFRADWATRLYELTGVIIGPEAGFSLAPTDAMPEPPTLPQPSEPPGNHVALLCSDQIWVGNFDGGKLVPLTAEGHRFASPLWSPDGRWLLTTLYRGLNLPASGLYLLPSGGGPGRILTDDPFEMIWPFAWDPQGREVVFHSWRRLSRRGSNLGVWGVDVETGMKRELPGTPIWSASGEHLIYFVPESTDRLVGSVWLADSDWANARQITDQALMVWQTATWSPDGSRVVLSLMDPERQGTTTAIYDLASSSLRPLAGPNDLEAALDSADRTYLTDETEAAQLAAASPTAIWPLSWSADGSQLLVWSYGNGASSPELQPALLATVEVNDSDRSPTGSSGITDIRVLAMGTGKYPASAHWSPTDPDRLVFSWFERGAPSGKELAFILDPNVETLPVYSSRAAISAARWSPDGDWVAFAGPDGAFVTSNDGRVSFTLQGPESCSDVVWNPAADLALH